jgi:hypothetical protein
MLRTISALLLMLSTTLGQQWYPFSEPDSRYWPSPPGYTYPTVYFYHAISQRDVNNVYTPGRYWVKVYALFRDRYITGLGHEGGGGGEFWVFLDPDTGTSLVPISSPVMLMSDIELDLDILYSQQFDPIRPPTGPILQQYAWFPQPILTGHLIHRTPQLGGTAFGVEVEYWINVQVLIGIMEVPTEVIIEGFEIHVIANLDTVLDGSGWLYKKISDMRR